MAKQKKLQQYVFKINSTLLRKNDWNLTLPLNRARNTTGLVVALADSQILSWINELNGTEDYDIQAKDIKRQIKEIKKQPVSRENKTKISNLYAFNNKKSVISFGRSEENTDTPFIFISFNAIINRSI